MRCLQTALLVFGLMTETAFAAESISMSVSLRKAVVLGGEAGIKWEVVLSNSTPNAIRFSHFSLASALRAAKFTDDAGHSWQMIRPKEIVDPPSPEIDFRLLIPAGKSVDFTLQTERLEQLSGYSSESPKPAYLRYIMERDVEVIDEGSKKSSFWKCVGNGIVEIKWPSVEQIAILSIGIASTRQ